MTKEQVTTERETRGWSKDELARRLRCSHTTVSLIERGKLKVSPSMAERLRQVFGPAEPPGPPVSIEPPDPFAQLQQTIFLERWLTLQIELHPVAHVREACSTGLSAVTSEADRLIEEMLE